jgi:hypothetical protein
LGGGTTWATPYSEITLDINTVWQINANVLIEATNGQACILIYENSTPLKSVMYQLDPGIGFANLAIDALVNVTASGQNYSICVIIKDPTTVYYDANSVSGIIISPPSATIYTWFSGHRIA